jgi:regulatory protein
MIVTDIVSVDKKKSKIYIDDFEEAFPLYKGEVRRLKLEIDEEVTSIQFKEIDTILKKRAKERALFILKSMDKTERDLRKKLKGNLYPEEYIDYAVEFLKKYGYIDDYRYAENYIRMHKSGKSKRIMSQNLLMKGIAKDIVEQVIEEFEEATEEDTEKKIIISLLKRKKYNPENEDPKEKNRIIAFLMRKGFNYEDISYCMKHYEDEYL